MTDRPRILVVGAGIIGASIAWHLARAGAHVTIVEVGVPGGVATPNSWAWINASHGNPPDYFRLRCRSMAEWRRLEREVSGIDVAWSGGLLWDAPPETLEAFATEHIAWGYDLRRVDRAEIRRIEPRLAHPPEWALHAPGEGAVEPLPATLALLAAARGAGATLTVPEPALSLDRKAARIVGVQTASGLIGADTVIVAVGAGTAPLVAAAGCALPVTVSPGLLAYTKPCARLLNGLVMTPGFHIRQAADGSLVAGADFSGTDPGEDAAGAAAELFAAMSGLFGPEAALAFDRFTIGHRPIPADGFPAVGFAPGIDGLYVAVMHSGITLAPAIGSMVAEEILRGRRDELLVPFGLDRFG